MGSMKFFLLEESCHYFIYKKNDVYIEQIIC